MNDISIKQENRNMQDSKPIESVVINEAINFIFQNIDKEIDVDDVAKFCGYSKFHLMRMFRKNTDEALYQFIKRIKLERSAWTLKVEKHKSITEIGSHFGYSSSNFATAFKKHLNSSPADFRKNSESLVNKSSFSHGMTVQDLEDSTKLITIEHLPRYSVIYERKKGNYHNLPEEWCTFIQKYENFADEQTLFIECTFDDPSITNENKCMYEMCQTVDPECKALLQNHDVLTKTFAGGKYAVYHFKGFPQFLFMVYQNVFCRWLSKTGNHLDEREVFDIYRYVGEDGYMEIDICFPIV